MVSRMTTLPSELRTPDAPGVSLQQVGEPQDVDRRLHPHCGALFQDRLWWDAYGRVHQLTEMSDEYLRNLEGFLRRDADLWVPRVESALSCAHCAPYLGGKVFPASISDDADPVEFMQGTSLASELRRLLAERGVERFGDDELHLVP